MLGCAESYLFVRKSPPFGSVSSRSVPLRNGEFVSFWLANSISHLICGSAPVRKQSMKAGGNVEKSMARAGASRFAARRSQRTCSRGRSPRNRTAFPSIHHVRIGCECGDVSASRARACCTSRSVDSLGARGCARARRARASGSRSRSDFSPLTSGRNQVRNAGSNQMGRR